VKKRNFLLLMMVFCFGLSAQAEIVRFLKVSDTFYRGSQPTTSEDYEMLKKKGVKTIINLRWDESVAKSKTDARAKGFNFINVPLRGDEKPAQNDIEKILKELTLRSNEPVFLHCTHGKDRTGLIAALYRVNEQGWSVEKAYKEWVDMGFAHRALHGLRSFFKEQTAMK